MYKKTKYNKIYDIFTNFIIIVHILLNRSNKWIKYESYIKLVNEHK